MKKSGSGMELFIPQLGNMLSMERQRFKAQPHARLGYPTKVPRHLPPTRKAASLRRKGGESHF